MDNIEDVIKERIKDAWINHFKHPYDTEDDKRQASFYHGIAYGLNDLLVELYKSEARKTNIRPLIYPPLNIKVGEIIEVD